MYTWTVVSVGMFLVCLYSLTICKAVQGTRFVFVICLSVSLLLSNIGSVFAVLTGHWGDLLITNSQKNPDQTLDINKLTRILDWETFCWVLRDSCLNEAVWIFSFRYWIISFLMPW